MRRLTATLFGVTAPAIVLAGCGGSNPDGFNDADTAYATGLISHHAQTLQLLDLTLGRDNLDPQIGTLADQIREDRFDETATAQRWLKTWGKKIPSTVLEHNHDQDGVTFDTSIPGVLSSQQLHTLEQAKGAVFAPAWLRQLIAHERGAVKLAADAIEGGQNTEVVAFAEKDERVHQQQVAQLERLQTS